MIIQSQHIVIILLIKIVFFHALVYFLRKDIIDEIQRKQHYGKEFVSLAHDIFAWVVSRNRIHGSMFLTVEGERQDIQRGENRWHKSLLGNFHQRHNWIVANRGRFVISTGEKVFYPSKLNDCQAMKWSFRDWKFRTGDVSREERREIRTRRKDIADGDGGNGPACDIEIDIWSLAN